MSSTSSKFCGGGHQLSLTVTVHLNSDDGLSAATDGPPRQQDWPPTASPLPPAPHDSAGATPTASQPPPALDHSASATPTSSHKRIPTMQHFRASSAPNGRPAPTDPPIDPTKRQDRRHRPLAPPKSGRPHIDDKNQRIRGDVQTDGCSTGARSKTTKGGERRRTAVAQQKGETCRRTWFFGV